MGLTGRDVTWPPRGTSPVEVTATVARGRLTARGTIDGAQRRGDIALTLRGADLATLQSWLPINGRVAGAADADLTAIVGLDPFSLSARGSVATSNLAFHDASRPLLTVTRAEMTGIDLQWPARLAIDRLRVNTPWAQIDRTPEGELSLRALFRRRPERPGAPAPVVSPPAAGLVAGLELSIGEALFENGGTNIVDDAVEPAARLEIRGSRLALRNLTWPAAGASTVQVSTPMPGGGVLKASGTFSIEPTQLRLDAELDQVDLAPGRPYLPFDARIAGKVTGRAKISGEFGDTITLVVDGDAAVDRLALGDLDRRLATAQRVELTGVRYRYPTSVRVRQLTLRKPWALVERNAGGDLEVVSLLGRRRRAVAGTRGGGAAGHNICGLDAASRPLRRRQAHAGGRVPALRRPHHRPRLRRGAGRDHDDGRGAGHQSAPQRHDRPARHAGVRDSGGSPGSDQRVHGAALPRPHRGREGLPRSPAQSLSRPALLLDRAPGRPDGGHALQARRGRAGGQQRRHRRRSRAGRRGTGHRRPAADRPAARPPGVAPEELAGRHPSGYPGARSVVLAGVRLRRRRVDRAARPRHQARVAAVQLDRSRSATPRTPGSSRSRSTRSRSRPPGRRRPRSVATSCSGSRRS